MAQGRSPCLTKATVGGVEYAVGGWGAFEIDRRRARWDNAPRSAAGPPGAAWKGGALRGGGPGVDRGALAPETPPVPERPGERYPGRTYIHAEDAALSLGGARAARTGRPSALRRAARRLAEALGPLEDRLCDPDDDGVWECAAPRPVLRRGLAEGGVAGTARALSIPPVTSDDLRAFAEDPAQEADPEALYDLSLGARSVAAAVGADVPGLPGGLAPGSRLPALPPGAVPVGDDEGVLELEAATGPFLAGLEGLQAALATQLEAVTAVVRRAAAADRKEGGGEDGRRRPAAQPPARDGTRAEAQTRGAAVDEAAARPPPRALLEAGLGWAEGTEGPFSLEAETGRALLAAAPLDGVYYGARACDDPARTTLLTPENLARAALLTSGRVYAWFVYDGPEGRFAVRAEPRDGAALRLDADALVAWLRPRLVGAPPHKIALDEYLARLRALGLEVAEGPRRRYSEARFDLRAATTAAERAAALAALRALTPEEFARFDWGEFDRAVGAEPCRSAVEVAGDAQVDLEARRVSAPKARPGTLWGSRPHGRSYVTYHTHPSERYRGSRAEAPSPADVLIALEACARDLQAWALVVAPEGTYVLRPSQALAAAYLHCPEACAEAVRKAYEAGVRDCGGSAEVCARRALAALAEAGFVAFRRGAPCLPLPPRPDLAPALNRAAPQEFREAFAALAAMPGPALLRVDWGPAAAQAEAPSVRAATWLTAGLRGGRAEPRGGGHAFGPPDDADSYPCHALGPLFVVYLPDEKGFPEAAPRAAIAAAEAHRDEWAWVVFLSATRVLALRAGPAGVEVHGPAPREGAEAPRKGAEAPRKASAS